MKRIYQGTVQFRTGENTYGIPINAITGPDGTIQTPGPAGPAGARGDSGKSPYINSDGCWVYYDDSHGQWVTSTVKAGGVGGSGIPAKLEGLTFTGLPGGERTYNGSEKVTIPIPSGAVKKNFGKLVIFGDSLPSGRKNTPKTLGDANGVYKNYDTIEGDGFANYLAESGCFTEVWNYAVQGSMLVHVGDSNAPLTTYASKWKDADMILFAFCGNDIKYIQAGTLAIKSVADKFDSIIDTIAAANPLCKIAFVSTVNALPTVSTIGTTGTYTIEFMGTDHVFSEAAVQTGMNMLNQLLAAKCLKRNVQFIMPYESTNIYKTGSTFLNDDGVHPNRTGAYRIGEHILDMLICGKSRLPDSHVEVLYDDFSLNGTTYRNSGKLNYDGVNLLLQNNIAVEARIQLGATGPYYFCQLSKLAKVNGTDTIEFVGGAKIMKITASGITVSDYTNTGTGSSGDSAADDSTGGSTEILPSIPTVDSLGEIVRDDDYSFANAAIKADGSAYPSYSNVYNIATYNVSGVSKLSLKLQDPNPANASNPTFYATYSFLSGNPSGTDIKKVTIGTPVVGEVNSSSVNVPSNAALMIVTVKTADKNDKSKYYVEAVAMRN